MRAVAAVVLIALSTANVSTAQTATLDAVSVQLLDGDLVGIRDGAAAARRRLKPREEIRWMQAVGRVGAVLTSERFLAMSPSSAGWREVHLTRGRDGASPYVELAAHLALCITDSRILVFSGPLGLLWEERLDAGERVLQSVAVERVGAIVTERRVLGFSSDFGRASELNLRAQERIESVRALATTVTVRTSKRLLIYRASLGTWTIEEG